MTPDNWHTSLRSTAVYCIASFLLLILLLDFVRLLNPINDANTLICAFSFACFLVTICRIFIGSWSGRETVWWSVCFSLIVLSLFVIRTIAVILFCLSLQTVSLFWTLNSVLSSCLCLVLLVFVIWSSWASCFTVRSHVVVFPAPSMSVSISASGAPPIAVVRSVAAGPALVDDE